MKNINLKIYRNSIWVYPFVLRDRKVQCTCDTLFKHFSVYEPSKRRFILNINIYDSKNQILKVPIGFGEDRVIEILELDDFNINIEDDRRNQFSDHHLSNVEMKDGAIPRDKYQVDATDFLMDSVKNQKMLLLDTGYGKTFCAIYSIVKLNMPALIISYNLSEQWIERISQYTNVDEDDIYKISGRSSIEYLWKTNKTYSFYVSTNRTLTDYIEEYGNIDDLLHKMKVGIKVFDEIHDRYSSNICIDVNSNTKYTYYLTATPNRTDFVENKIFKKIFDGVERHGIYTRYEKIYCKLRLVDYNTRGTTLELKQCMMHKGFSAIKYFDYIFSDNMRKIYIIGIVKYLLDKIYNDDETCKTLVIIPKIEYLDVMKEILDKMKNNFIVGVYNSTIKQEERITVLNNSNVILSTLQSASTGLDLPKLRAILSLTPFRSSVIAHQLFGRLRDINDKNVYFYDFLDTCVTPMIRQRKERMRIIRPKSQEIDSKLFDYEDIINYLKEEVESKED